MLTLDKLSDELLEEIFDLIHNSSRHTIFSLILVSKTISELALPFAYRELTFNLGTSGYDLLDSLLELDDNSVVWKGVRKVTVKSGQVRWEDLESSQNSQRQQADAINSSRFVPSEKTVEKRWGPFIELISRVLNIQDLEFDCGERVPIVLLRALEEKHPYCRLHVRNWTRLCDDMPLNDPYEKALARSSLLVSIDAVNWDWSELYQAAFNRIIASAPRLNAIIYREEFSMQCTDPEISPQELAEVNREKERLRRVAPKKRAGLRDLQWSGLDLSVLKQLESRFDLQDIHSLDALDVGDRHWIEYAESNRIFSGLRHFKIGISGVDGDESFKTSLDFFLASCPPLESLSIGHYHSYVDFPSALYYHGDSLRSLSLGESEIGYGRRRPVLSQVDVDFIRFRAPHLESLQLDINRTINPNESEEAIYKIISSFLNLRTLTIYYDLGLHHRYYHSYWFERQRVDEPEEMERFLITYSRVDHQFARSVWEAVAGKRLESLVLYIGDPDRKLGYPEDWHYEELRRRQVVCVRRNERDDLKDEISALEIDIKNFG
ncbi:hypothetical protein PM082_009451 [Marasmius tenuissimus]|nr:hypothetical protein PM082_009451 [Marasmius tenuissimus]